MGKIIKNNSNRQQRIEAALNKKPTAADLNRRGLTPEALDKIFVNGRPPSHISKKIHTKTDLIRPKSTNKANQVKFYQAPKPVQVPIHEPDPDAISVPSWFETTGDIDVSIIVPMFKSGAVIIDQIRSWDLEDDGLKKEIIYVDDLCPDKSNLHVIKAWSERSESLKAGVGKIILNDVNVGYGTACNIGAEYASGKYLIFLNADCVVTKNWIKPLIEDLKADEKIGIVGNMQLKHNDTIDSAGSEWSWSSKTFEHIGRNILDGRKIAVPVSLAKATNSVLTPCEREMVTGCCFAMPKFLFDMIGGFDPLFKIGYWEDSDINMRVKSLGYKVWYQPNSKIYHKGGHSRAYNHPFLQKNQQNFYKKWVDTRFIDLFVKPRITNTSKIDKNKITVYTAITNKYDNLIEKQCTNDIKFISFLEETTNSKTWEFKEANKTFTDSNRNAKIHKILSHKYFPNSEYTLWIDGSVKLNFPVDQIIKSYLPDDYDMLIFNHPERSCLYDEANICIQYKLDDPMIIRKQIERYRREGYPEKAGLVEATIILRKNTEKVAKFNELWWDEICNGSKRDQISFNYVAKKLNFKYATFPGCLRTRRLDNTILFDKAQHNKHR